MRPAFSRSLCRPRFRPAPLAVALSLLLSSGALMAQGSAAVAEPLNISIPAQPLGDALNAWARQTGLQLAVQQTLVAGKTAPAVTGRLTPRQALDQLLAGSGLAATLDGAAVFVRPAAPTRSENETMLPAVRVQAGATAKDSSLRYLSADATAGALGDKPLLDTPFSVTVVDAEQITERGAKSIGQIFVNDPSVYTPTSSSTTDWWGTQIRGLPVRNAYIDEIPMMLYWGGDFPTEVAESVSALKGLTGFMYGFGEPGGALSYRLKRPKATDETVLNVGYRNNSLWSAHVDTSHHLADDLAVRANLATEQGTAYNQAKLRRTVGSLAVEKRFGAVATWTTTLMLEDSKNKAEPLQFYLDAYDTAGSGGQLPPATYRYGNVNIDNSYYQTKTLLAATAVQWQIDDAWKARLQGGYSRKDHQSNKSFAYLLNRDGDYTGTMYNFASRIDSVFTQAMLQGTVHTGALRHEIVGGVGLQRNREASGTDYHWAADYDFLGNIYREQTFVSTRPTDFSLGPVSYDVQQQYGFLSDTVHLGPQWQAILGVRFTDYRLKDLDGNPAVDSAYKVSKASPTVALVYKPAPETSLYASYIEGLEPGTRVRAPYANAGELLGATVSKQYEAGLKHASGKLDFTAAVFRIERANQRDTLRNGQRYLSQDGLLTYQGAEFSGAYQVTRELNVGLGSIYLDAKIDKVSPDSAALEGNRPSYTPRWQHVATVQYRVPGLDGLKLHGNARYFGTSYVTDANELQVPDRTLLNAGFSYDLKIQARDWTLIGNVYNLLNTKYWAGGGWGSGNLGEARNLSLALRTRF